MADENFERWDVWEAEVDEVLGQVVRAAGFNVEGRMKRKAPKDTGFLANSIYTKTERESRFNGALAASKRRVVHSFKLGKSERRNAAHFARRNREEAQFASMLFPEVPTPGHNEAMVAVGAIYGWFVNRGTHKMAARPFADQAVAEERGPFVNAIAKALRKAIGGS